MTYASRHAWMLLPYDPPPPPAEGGRLPSPPSLWRRTQDFLASLTAKLGPLAAFASRTLGAAEQRDVLGRLEPLEKLARALLIVRALTFLLMTPQGRRLMRETRKSPCPQKPSPPRASDNHRLSIPYPGWSTIGRHHAACAAAAMPAGQLAAAPADPAERSAPFRVCAWRFPKDAPEDAHAPQQTALKKPLIAILDADPRAGFAAPKPHEPKLDARSLARRIAALTRIIADPARPVARLARWLARLPHEALQGLTETFVRVRTWWSHGVEDAIAAAAHVRRAACILLHPEPG